MEEIYKYAKNYINDHKINTNKEQKEYANFL
jgi:hypothetical protein